MNVRLAVLGRAPIAGRVKTRLAPALGRDGAAGLYAAFLQDVLAQARTLAGAHVLFWSTDPPHHHGLQNVLDGIAHAKQPEGDLGARMLHALEEGIETHGRCLLLGSDAPTLPAAHLALALATLARPDVDACLGPSADGGYYLVGARRTHPRMFEAVRWSSRFSLQDTERAFRKAGLRTERLSGWYDVDTPRDLALLRAHLTLAPGAAPASARWLADWQRKAKAAGP